MATHGGSRQGAGRKVASHTLQAQVLRQKLIDMYEVAAEAISLKLIEKALQGDMLAIKELHERVYGKAYQSGELEVTTNQPVVQLSDAQYKQALAAAAKRSNSNQSGS